MAKSKALEERRREIIERRDALVDELDQIEQETREAEEAEARAKAAQAKQVELERLEKRHGELNAAALTEIRQALAAAVAIKDAHPRNKPWSSGGFCRLSDADRRLLQDLHDGQVVDCLAIEIGPWARDTGALAPIARFRMDARRALKQVQSAREELAALT